MAIYKNSVQIETTGPLSDNRCNATRHFNLTHASFIFLLAAHWCRHGWEYVTFTCECTKMIPHLLGRFKSLGGEIVPKKIVDLKQLARSFDFVINCSGLGAVHLAADSTVRPKRGQLIRVKLDFRARHMWHRGHWVPATYLHFPCFFFFVFFLYLSIRWELHGKNLFSWSTLMPPTVCRIAFLSKLIPVDEYTYGYTAVCFRILTCRWSNFLFRLFCDKYEPRLYLQLSGSLIWGRLKTSTFRKFSVLSSTTLFRPI